MKKSLFKNTNISKYKKYYFVFAVLFSLKFSANIFIKDSADFYVAPGAIVSEIEAKKSKTKIYITEGTTISNPKMLSNSEITILSSEKNKTLAITEFDIHKSHIEKQSIERKNIQQNHPPEFTYKEQANNTSYFQLKEKNPIAFTNNPVKRLFSILTCYLLLLCLILLGLFHESQIYKKIIYNLISGKDIKTRPPPVI
ncbi:hypothetical protein [Daejeonia sp. YH14]|uniref:hypothetical protein n=1 Tax=Daejeonia sp. YH14 TaxID=3439042 RepID=UPI003F49B2EC